MMAKLENIRQQTGMEIQGLLVGKKESPALSSLCTDVHDFLVDYELGNHIRMISPQLPTMPLSSTALYANQRPRSVSFAPYFSLKRTSMVRTRNTSLYAVQNAQVDEVCVQRKREAKVSKKRQRFIEDDEEWEWGGDEITFEGASRSLDSSTSRAKLQSALGTNDNFVERLEGAHQLVRNMASERLNEWSRSEIDTGIQQEAKLSMRQILLDCISFIESGLVERDKEAKLVGEFF